MSVTREIFRAAAALAALAAAAAPVSAQDAPEAISPLKVELDHNNVNLLTGKTEIEMPVLTAPGAGRLRFDRVQNAAPYVVSVYSVGDPDQRAVSHSVHTGAGASESFNCQGDHNCESVTWSGSMINEVRTYTQAGSGASWRFNVKRYDTRPSTDQRSQYYASFVQYPDGERIDYNYGSAIISGQLYFRPATISTSLGYTIGLTYHSDLGDSNDWAKVKEAVLAVSGSSIPIQKFTYSADGATITDIGGRVFGCSGCWNQMGSRAETWAGSFQLPGESSPALQVAAHPGAPVVSAVTKDGVGWSYGYTNLRLNAHASGYLYDTLTVTGPDGFHAVHDLAVRQLTLGGVQTNVLTGSTNALGHRTAYGFDAGSRPTSMTLPEGNKVTVAYDARGNVILRTTIPKGGGTGFTETAYYDEAKCDRFVSPVMCYRPDYVRDGLGRQTDFLYNARGQVTERTDPADQSGVRKKTYVTYEPGALSRRSVVQICGYGSTCGTGNEIRTEYQYWGNSFLPSLERRIDAAQGTTLDTVYNYDSAGRLISTDGPLSGSDDASYFRYDVHGRKTWEIGPKAPNGLRLASVTTYRDSDDKPVAVENGTVTDPNSATLTPLSRTDTTYDSRRNPVAQALSSDNIVYTLVHRSFQAVGRLECEARRMHKDAFPPLSLGACNLGTPGTEGPDRITRNVYDAAGQLLIVQRAVGTSVQQDYARYEYTPNGKQKAVIDANGNRAEMVWDGFDRQRRWIFPSNTPGYANQADYEEYGYDPVGNRTSLRKRDGAVIGFQYDALNRMISKDVPEAGGDVAYSYDVRGLQLSALYSATGLGIASAYDGFGRQVSSTTNLDGSSRTYSFQYDSAGNRTRVIHPDGPWFGYDYDALGRMTALKEWTGTTLVALGYHPSGLRSIASYANGVVTSYAYDPIGRLTGLTLDLIAPGQDVTFAYAHNSASQIVSRDIDNDSYVYAKSASSTGYAVNGLNQYTQVGSGAVVHDANGNLTQQGGRNLAYDSENRLTAITTPQNYGLDYDPQGRFRALTFGGIPAAVFDMVGTDIVALRHHAGSLVDRQVFGPGVDEPMVVYDGAGTRQFYHADGHGSIIARSNGAGSAALRIAYDEYGRPSTTGSRFLYAGKIHLGGISAYYNNARFYDYNLGRFLQTDPIGYDDQINLYAYVGNDPINQADPTGEAVEAGCGSRLGDSASCSGETLLGQIEAARAPHGPREYGQGGSSRPAKQKPGGRITEEQARCRSCHGVGTDDDRRYPTEAENEFLIDLASLIPAVRITQIPRRVHQVARVVDRTGAAPRGYAGGRPFQNREGRLPAGGKYREFDIDPRPLQGPRNAERIVIDSKTGRRWYTPDHYKTFSEF